MSCCNNRLSGFKTHVTMCVVQLFRYNVLTPHLSVCKILLSHCTKRFRKFTLILLISTKGYICKMKKIWLKLHQRSSQYISYSLTTTWHLFYLASQIKILFRAQDSRMHVNHEHHHHSTELCNLHRPDKLINRYIE